MGAEQESASGYNQDAAFFDDVNPDRSREIDFYREVLSGRETLLDIGCGTGQLTRPLAISRRLVVGIDNSEGMLDMARKTQAPPGDCELVYREAAMPRFELGERFAACISTFNTFMHLLTWQDAMTFLQSVRSHLRPDGVFVFDVFNPCFDFLVDRRGPEFKLKFQSRAMGAQIVLSEITSYDRATQINHVEYIYTTEGEPEPLTTHRFEMRQYFPQELDALIHLGGFEIVRKYGDFDHSPLSGTSPLQIPVCRIRR